MDELLSARADPSHKDLAGQGKSMEDGNPQSCLRLLKSVLLTLKKQESAECVVSLNLYELVTFWCLESESSSASHHAWPAGQEQAERFAPLHPAEATSLL